MHTLNKYQTAMAKVKKGQRRGDEYWGSTSQYDGGGGGGGKWGATEQYVPLTVVPASVFDKPFRVCCSLSSWPLHKGQIIVHRKHGCNGATAGGMSTVSCLAHFPPPSAGQNVYWKNERFNGAREEGGGTRDKLIKRALAQGNEESNRPSIIQNLKPKPSEPVCQCVGIKHDHSPRQQAAGNIPESSPVST